MKTFSGLHLPWAVAAGQLDATPGFTLWTIDTTAPTWSVTNLGGAD